ncbi:hypothetical protein F5141DRAFT_1068473 [Pisolithus sp. B1]|nr:hypothetical protein F5141DRAFT_1068473 [Pisolithus sp. B1]
MTISHPLAIVTLHQYASANLRTHPLASVTIGDCWRTSFHLATKPLLWLTVDEASVTYWVPDLEPALATFFANRDTSFQVLQLAVTKLQIWHKFVHPGSNWPGDGLAGHSISQLCMIFCLVHSDLFLTYVQHFNIVPQSNPINVNPVTAHLVPNFGCLQLLPKHISPYTDLVMDSFPVSDSNEKTPQKSQQWLVHVTPYNQ